MDIELLKLVLSKSSSIDEARKFLVDFTGKTRQEIKGAELALSFSGGLEPVQPAKPAVTSDKRVVKSYTKGSTQPNAPAKAGRHWDRHELAALARVLVDLGPIKPNFSVLAATFHRTEQAMVAMCLNLVHFSLEGKPRSTWPNNLIDLFEDAMALPEWPTSPINDYRTRSTIKKREA